MGKQFRGEIRAQVIEFVYSWLGKNQQQQTQPNNNKKKPNKPIFREYIESSSCIQSMFTWFL